MKSTLLLGALVGGAVTAAAWYLTTPDTDPRPPGSAATALTVAADGTSESPTPPPAGVRSAPYRESRVETSDLPTGMKEVLAERRFINTRRKVSEKLAEMLGDDAHAIERRIANEEQLLVASRLAKNAMRAENEAHFLVADVASKIGLVRLDAGRFDRVSLVGHEARSPACEGRQGYRIPKQRAEFPEQFVLTSTLMLEGEEPVLRVVRINPGESQEFDALNEKRMGQLRLVRSELRTDLARLDTLALNDEEIPQ